jgi:hypothetical protein
MAKKSPPAPPLAQKPSVIPFRPLARPVMPATVLPLPTGAVVPEVVERPAAIDLAGKRKVWFLIGRGRIGKTTFTRWAAETMSAQGGSAVVAAADPVNRSLRVFLNDVAEPPSSDPGEVKDWLRELLLAAMEEKFSALIDLGGGSTALSALLGDMPDLADVLTQGGIEPVAIHIVGPDPHDLVPLALAEAEGFRPRATAIVLNEVHGRRHRFGQVLRDKTLQAALERGAIQLWMPQLTPDAARLCDAHAWHYHDVKGRADAFTASSVLTWLRRMEEEMAPILSWLPE